jgi:hypothetical protein
VYTKRAPHKNGIWRMLNVYILLNLEMMAFLAENSKQCVITDLKFAHFCELAF